MQKGDFAAAQQAYANALAKKEASLGRHHPEYAATLAQLAEVVRVQGRLDDAAALLRQAADVLDAVGAGHTRIAIARLGRLAAVLTEAGKLSDAVAVHRRLLQSAESAPDPKPSALVQAQTGLADALCRIGRHDEAGDLYRQSLAVLQGLGADAGSDTATAVVRRRLAETELAVNAADAAALDRAERLLLDAVAALRVAVERDTARSAGAPPAAPGGVSGAAPGKAAASAKRADDAAATNRLELASALAALAALQARRGRADAAAETCRAAHDALQHVASGAARDALAAKLQRLRR
jgi:tetratricopeptide (TPR) repeat protein